MVSATPDVRLSTQPKNTASRWPVLISHHAEEYRRLSWPKLLVTFVCDIAVLVLKRDVKLQPTNQPAGYIPRRYTLDAVTRLSTNRARRTVITFARVVDDAKCIVVTRVCVFVCLSVRGRTPTLLHGPGCNLGAW